MHFTLKIILLIFILAFLLGAFFLNTLLARIASSEEFRHFAEQKVGEYLKAKVNIGEIRPYRFNQIAIDKIIIETPSVQGASQFVHIERLFFRYHWNQLWNRRFDAPAGVVLKNPAILIDQNHFPYHFFENGNPKTAGLTMPSLDFKGGEIRYLLPSVNKEILLTEVAGKMMPALDQTVQVDVRAKVSGFLKGTVRICGTIQSNKSSHNLSMELEDMSFSNDIPVPLTEMKGKVRWVDQDLFFDDLQANLHGWQTALTGSFLNHQGQPAITLHARVGKGTPWFKLDFSLNLLERKFEGVFQPAAGTASNFRGNVFRKGKKFLMESFWVDPGYHGRGEWDFATGNYELIFEKGTKRLAVHSNLRGLEFVLYFHLDHWRVLGLDLVTQGKLFLRHLTPHWRSKELLFRGNFETDYFILERQPFEDLKGTFELSPYGITNLRTSWGTAFQMAGQVVFLGKKPKIKCLLRVSDFNLGLVHEFASKPLPKELGGFLDGKLSIEGEMNKPEITGTFNVQDGKWGRLRYDRGIIRFRGFPPYFPMEGSKILKGRSTFFLTGAIDLKLDNVFAGVKIETPDHLVIWKGLEATLHEADRSVELNRSKLGKWGELSVFEAETHESNATEKTGGLKDSEDENVVQFGPKLKF
ncbi:MAG TPA: hypothetical protein PLO78_09515 [Candidatus Omnitrophota bacterium]|nr:hypothetical protein [Candidatus Omnitrophota bacterium]